MAGGAGAENRILALLTLNFGATFLTRNATGFLAPFLRADLDLSNVQLGLLSSGLACAWALSSLTLGLTARMALPRRTILTALGVLMGLASLVGAFAGSFLMLFAARIATGLVSGPVLPVSQSIVTEVSAPAHRGLRMGILQTFGGALFGALLAPLVLVPLADRYGWRVAFEGVAGVSLIVALLVRGGLTPQDPAPAQSTPAGQPRAGRLADALRSRNVPLCSLIGGAMVAWLIIGTTFYPLYLVNVVHATDGQMSRLMSVLGISSMVAAILVPHLSDRYGRKPAMVIFALLGAVLPLALLHAAGAGMSLAAAMFIGGLAGGTFPLFMATIPAESASPALVAVAIGIVQGIAEFAGGVCAPFGAGWFADAMGLRSAVWICAACAGCAAMLALGLTETAPARLRPRIG